MEEKTEKENTFNIITHINELMFQSQLTQYFKNTKETPIELEMIIPKLNNCNITKFEMIKNNQKIVSKLLEKEKAKEKYVDAITMGNSGFLSYNDDNEVKTYLGNIPPGEEIELKTFFFSHIINRDLSYQATFPVIFPNFIMNDPNSKEGPENYEYEKQIVEGKIYINTRSRLTRLVVKGSKNFDKIEKKIGEDKKNAEIDFLKNNFNDKDIPGIIIFRTEKINEEVLYYQSDQRRKKSYYMLQKTLIKPEFSKEFKDQIDEDENLNYVSMLKNEEKEEKEKSKACYIFLLDQSGSMMGDRIELSCKSLLLFLQSLNENCYFQLIGFGSDFKFFSDKPLEYNKENVKNLMDTIKTLSADRGGTNLYDPLKEIYQKKLYNDYKMKKNIIVLTDGELDDKEKVINLIGANSSEFTLNTIGIMDCDQDLIERAALVGNGFSFYISDLNELNSVVISLLEKTQNSLEINCKANQKYSIEKENKLFINKYYFFTYGFVLDEINIKDIEFNIQVDKEKTKINFDKNKIIKLPDGDNLGKLIIDNYLKHSKNLSSKTKINLSKEYNVLINETAFYAKILNEVPVTDKMIKITNEDKQASNNKIEESQNKNTIEENNDYIYNDELFANYEIEEQPAEQNKNFISKFFSKLFSSDNDNIIKKQYFKYKEKKIKISKKAISARYAADVDYAAPPDDDGYDLDVGAGYYCSKFDRDDDYDMEYDSSPKMNNENIIKEEVNNNKIEIKKEFKFDEFILSQDIIEGNWTKDMQCEVLIEQEKDIYEKIKKYSENKGIKDENGIITLFILYYIFNKKSDKIGELKFVINKAKNYVKKIFNLDYDVIIKDL